MALERARFVAHRSSWRPKYWDILLFLSKKKEKILIFAMYCLLKVLTETSYTRSVDWWGLGVLIFEMLVGEVRCVATLLTCLLHIV